MIEVIRGAVAIIFLFSFAIFIHELGHFMFAKLFGVYVETFSIGFGKKIWRRQWGETEYAISLVPFGGYVKMKGMMSKEMEALFDEEKSTKAQKDPEENVVGPSHIAAGEPAMEEVAGIHIPHTADKAGAGAGEKIANLSESVVDEMAALRTKPYYQRLLIFSAGCINNLLTAVFVFFMMNWIGHYQPEPFKPIVGLVQPAYASEVQLQKNDRVVKVGPKDVATFDEFLTEFIKQATENKRTGKVEVTVTRGDNRVALALPAMLAANPLADKEKILKVGEKSAKSLEKAAEIARVKIEARQPVQITTRLNGKTQTKTVPAVALAGNQWPIYIIDAHGPAHVGITLPNLPAEKAGIKANDLVIAVNGKPVQTYAEAAEDIRALGGNKVPITVERGKGEKKERLTLNVEVRDDPEIKGRGQIGIHWGGPRTQLHKMGAVAALKDAVAQVAYSILRYYRGLKMLFGSSWRTIRENVGGPIAIGNTTYQMAQLGWVYFFNWMAMFNIILAVTNLLPLPVLDGGHIVFATVEAIIRRPLPAKAMMWMYNIFISLFLGLVVLITANDFIMNAWRLFN